MQQLLRILRPSVVLGVAMAMCLLSLTGCSGGWGETKPIITAIAGSAVNSGQKETLSVSPTGTGPFTYQWYRNGVAVPGATSSTYSMTAGANDNGAAYTVAVTNAAGTMVSAPFVLNVGVGPSITTQPASLAVSAGQPAIFTVAATGTATLSYQWYENGAPIPGATTSTYTTAASSVADSGAVFSVAVSNAVGQVTSAQAILTVTPLSPVLTFSNIGQKTYGDPTFAIAASSASAGHVTYSVSSGPATVSGSTVTITGAGVVVLAASQAADGNYTAASATTTFTVRQATPTLNLAAIGNQPFGATTSTSATSNSNGAISYAISSGPATIAGSTITTTGVGTVTVTASQAATPNYTAASATTIFAVGQATPTLNLAAIGNQPYGTTVTATATSNSNGAITYAVTGGPATIAGSLITTTGVGTVTVTASQAATTEYAAASATTTFTVGQATPTLNLASIANQAYGATTNATATSNSNGAITYAVTGGPATIAGSTITPTGVGTVTVTASQAATTNYAAASATTTFTVGQATPTLNFATVPSHTYGDASFQVSATSASNGTISYRVVSGPATIVGNTVSLTGAGTVVLAASQSATPNYTTATVNTQFAVASQVTLSAVSPANTTMAPGPQQFSANAVGGVTGGLTWTATGGSIDANGNWTSPNVAGVYTITATSTDQTSVHTSTTVTVSAPVISTQPVSQNLCGYGNISLSVTASYASSYQWYLNGTALPGATGPTYSVSSATSAEAGNYAVLVTNAAGSVTSGVATEVVGSSITTNPASLSITQYQTASFDVAATGKAPFTYQWYSTASGAANASVITGATASTYITPVQTATTPAGTPSTYYVTVTDTCGTTLTSSIANLAVVAGNSPPTITAQPTGQTVVSGNTANFAVTAVGSGTLSYQWYRIPQGGTNQEILGSAPVTGTAIAGATSSTYTVPTSATYTTNDQDVYYAQVTNAYGTAVSQHATLAVGSGVQIQITDQPVNSYVNAGAPASFTVAATSTLPLTYQWYMVPAGQSAAAQTITTTSGSATTTASAVAISGATSPTYTIPAATSSQTGSVYYATVSNGQTTSVITNAASLTVGTPVGIPACSSGWNILGTTTSFNSANCSYQLTAAQSYQYGEIVWPALISTGNLRLSFTITTSNPSNPPADGFAVVLGDPSLGARLNSAGQVGEGLGARGIPGFVVAFDDFYNSSCTTGCNPAPYPTDPSTASNPDYLGVGRSEGSLWENPYFNVNTNLPVLSGDSYALAQYGRTISRSYVVSIVSGYMSVTMDGQQVFSGNVSVPPVAYLYVTSSTGGSWEQTVISNISATVSAPSN